MSGVRLLVVCALVLAHVLSTEGQSEGLLDNSTLTEWSRLADSTSSSLAGGGERQYLFTGLRFQCNGNVTKWIVRAGFGGTSRTRHPALGIYRDHAGGGFADRVGATVLAPTISISSRIYEFTPASPLPFQTNDSLGIYLRGNNELRLQPLYRQVTDGPASRRYDPPSNSNPAPEGVSTFVFAQDPTEETDRLPLVAVEIESDDPDSADCTRDFISRDLLELLAPPNLGILSNQQIVFPSYNFTSDGSITSWTVAAGWVDGTDRTSFPELQIWRRRSGDAYDKIASTNLTATAERPNQLYSGTIDPPLQFQSGDLLGMYLPRNVSNNGARLLVLFAEGVGQTYETRITNAPLTSIMFGQETGNDRPLLALEISPETDPTVPTTPAASTSIIPVTSASPPTTGVPSASPPTELLPVIAIAVGASVGGVTLAAVTVLIIVAAVACARKKSQNPTDRSVDAINMTATAEDTYGYPFHEPTAVATKRNEPYANTAITTEQNEAYASTAITTEQNEAYASTAITTEQNEAYASTAITTEQNEAYATTAITTCTEQNETHGGTTAADEYEYI